MFLIVSYSMFMFLLSVNGDAGAAVEPEFKLDGIHSGSCFHHLPMSISHWLWEGDCTAVVC